MAQDPKQAKEFANAQRVAAEAVEDTNELIQNLGGLLEKRIHDEVNIWKKYLNNDDTL